MHLHEKFVINRIFDHLSNNYAEWNEYQYYFVIDFCFKISKVRKMN